MIATIALRRNHLLHSCANVTRATCAVRLVNRACHPLTAPSWVHNMFMFFLRVCKPHNPQVPHVSRTNRFSSLSSTDTRRSVKRAQPAGTNYQCPRTKARTRNPVGQCQCPLQNQEKVPTTAHLCSSARMRPLPLLTTQGTFVFSLSVVLGVLCTTSACVT